MSIAERIKLYHTSLFSPTLQTLAKAIYTGHLTTFPSITSQQVQKYLPHSEETVKGHIKAIKKGLKYFQILSHSINNTTATVESTPTILEEYDIDDIQTPAPNP